MAERAAAFAAAGQAELGVEGKVYEEVRCVGAVGGAEEEGATEMGTAMTVVVAAKLVLD